MSGPRQKKPFLLSRVLETERRQSVMGAAEKMNPVELLVEIIKEHVPEDIWQGSPLIGYRHLGNTNRGEIGEEFIRRYLKKARIPVGNGGRTSRTDMQIAGHAFEVKTASLGANG